MKNTNQLIGCCGLDCEKCNARIATLTNDNALREKTAVLWTKLNGVTITADRGALEDFSGKNQDTTSFNRFTVVSVYRVYSSSLSPLFAAIADDFSFYRFLCTAYGTGGAVPWSQNADIDMDQ